MQKAQVDIYLRRCVPSRIIVMVPIYLIITLRIFSASVPTELLFLGIQAYSGVGRISTRLFSYGAKWRMIDGRSPTMRSDYSVRIRIAAVNLHRVTQYVATL